MHTHEVLNEAVTAGVAHNRLLRTEKDILEKTLNGCLKTMTEVVSLSNPDAFGRASRIQRYVPGIIRPMGMTETWRLETAAMLSQIGAVSLPGELIRKRLRREVVTEQEQHLYDQHPQIEADVVSPIPPLKEVADVIDYQEKRFDGSGPPSDSRNGREIPVEARILKLITDFDALENSGLERDAALQQRSSRSGWYDPLVFEAMKSSFQGRKSTSHSSCD